MYLCIYLFCIHEINVKCIDRNSRYIYRGLISHKLFLNINKVRYINVLATRVILVVLLVSLMLRLECTVYLVIFNGQPGIMYALSL